MNKAKSISRDKKSNIVVKKVLKYCWQIVQYVPYNKGKNNFLPFESKGGKLKELRIIQSLSKSELSKFLNRDVTSYEYELVHIGGIAAAAFILPEFTWKDARKASNIHNHKMVRDLIHNKQFIQKLTPEAYHSLKDLYFGTAPAEVF